MHRRNMIAITFYGIVLLSISALLLGTRDLQMLLALFR